MRNRVRRVLAHLARAYPNAATELHYHTPFQLLVATMLSAQCTDRRVNMITPRLFARYPDAAALAAADLATLENLIRDCGLYRTKAKNIKRTAELLVERHQGEVPADRNLLMALPGVGRKTANVVIANAFGQDAIAVDTHVFRVTHRLGWADAKDADGTEGQLMTVIPREQWSQAHHWLIWHGRRVCTARKPRCNVCFIASDCPRLGVVDAVGESAVKSG
jgi:endonuclease-3